MKNKEYLFTLCDEELASYLTCKACFREYIDEEQEKCFGHCESCQVEWLNSEHLEKPNSTSLDTVS